MKTLLGVGAAAAALVMAPVAHADQYVGMAIYDPPGPTVHVVHEGQQPSEAAALESALRLCNSQYSGACSPVGATTTCMSVIAGPGIVWVYDTGPDLASAESNARDKASAQGWDRSGGKAITHCAWDD